MRFNKPVCMFVFFFLALGILDPWDKASSEENCSRDVTKYVTYRPKYPVELVEIISREFKQNELGRLLDLGCGSGQITFLLAANFAQIVALDIDDKMIQEAENQSAKMGIDHILWKIKPAETVSKEMEGCFDLITIATAFHWMDRPLVLSKCYDLLQEGGGIAIFTAKSWWNSTIRWQQEIVDLIKKYQGCEQPAYVSIVSNAAHEPLLHDAHFKNIKRFVTTTQYKWTVDTIFGYLYSTTYCAPSKFGKRLQEFEKEAETLFLKHNPSGVFIEEFQFDILLGYKEFAPIL